MICFVSGSNSVVHVSTFQTNISAFREQKAVVHIFLVMWVLAWILIRIPSDYTIFPLWPQQQWNCWFLPNLVTEKCEPRGYDSGMQGEFFWLFFFSGWILKGGRKWFYRRGFAFMVLGLSWNNQQHPGKIDGHTVSHADSHWAVVFNTSLYQSVLLCLIFALQGLREEAGLENLIHVCTLFRIRTVGYSARHTGGLLQCHLCWHQVWQHWHFMQVIKTQKDPKPCGAESFSFLSIWMRMLQWTQETLNLQA